MRILGKFVINLALPVWLFNALAQHPVGESLNGPYLLVCAPGLPLTLDKLLSNALVICLLAGFLVSNVPTSARLDPA